jgi:hypothetical protein
MLGTYLNDHLAGATAGRELARRAARNNRRSPCGPFLEQLANELDEDRRILLEIMQELDIGIDHLKVLGGWGAEKLGRLKLNGRLLGYSPLSRVVEIETLLLAVHGKLALWRTLERLAGQHAELDMFDFPSLRARAETQIEGLEANRLLAVDEALS